MQLKLQHEKFMRSSMRLKFCYADQLKVYAWQIIRFTVTQQTRLFIREIFTTRNSAYFPLYTASFVYAITYMKTSDQGASKNHVARVRGREIRSTATL